MINTVQTNLSVSSNTTLSFQKNNAQLTTNQEASATFKQDKVSIGQEGYTKVAYARPKNSERGHKTAENDFEKIRERADRAYAYLKDAVKEMIKQQGGQFREVEYRKESKVEQDRGATPVKNQFEVADYWNVENTAKRIVDFAKSLAGGDPSKISMLKEAVEKGFAEAKKLLGGELPQISKETYDEVMRLFNEWEQSYYISTRVDAYYSYSPQRGARHSGEAHGSRPVNGYNGSTPTNGPNRGQNSSTPTNRPSETYSGTTSCNRPTETYSSPTFGNKTSEGNNTPTTGRPNEGNSGSTPSGKPVEGHNHSTSTNSPSQGHNRSNQVEKGNNENQQQSEYVSETSVKLSTEENVAVRRNGAAARVDVHLNAYVQGNQVSISSNSSVSFSA